MAGLRIAAVNTPLAPALRGMGHTVLDLFLENGVHDLPALLERHGFTPDLVLHMENLGRRGLLTGLSALPCPKIFWSVDTHLNAWWHCWYGRLYDLVLTTQEPWVDRLTRLGLARVGYLPAPGAAVPWVPHGERPAALAFIGRLTGQRPARSWMIELVNRLAPCAVLSDVPPRQVPARYAQARVAPNEAILGEVNFRLFEAASAGCLVLHQEGEAGVSGLFTPGVEILTYGHALEFTQMVRRALECPAATERMGRAAWERIRREHLPVHRAARLLDLARGLPAAAVPAPDAELAWEMTRFHLHEAGMLPAEPGPLAASLARLDAAPARAALLRLLAMEGGKDRAVALLLESLDRGESAEPEVDQAASAAALKFGLFDLAKRFWYRRWEARSRAGEKLPFAQPRDPAHLHALWAGELSRLGRVFRPGMPFDESRHAPATAVESLFAARHLAGGSPDLDLERRLCALLAKVPGQEHMRLGLLSDLSLHHPADWRVSLDLALVNLRAFRPEQGLAELAAARAAAQKAGQEDRLLRALAPRDPGRTILAALLGAGAA